MNETRDESGAGITASYGESKAGIHKWKANAEHLETQRMGKVKWYSNYSPRIARILREYHFEADAEPTNYL